MLHTLEGEGYVVRLAHGCYGLGPKLSALFRLFQERFDVARVARPLMADLADELGEDTFLAVLRSGEVAVVEIVRGSRRLHLPEPGVGFIRVAHVTAIGKVLLAAQPPDEIDDYLRSRPLDACTSRTLVERREIADDLARVERPRVRPRPRGAVGGLLLRGRPRARPLGRDGRVAGPVRPARALPRRARADRAALPADRRRRRPRARLRRRRLGVAHPRRGYGTITARPRTAPASSARTAAAMSSSRYSLACSVTRPSATRPISAASSP